MLTMREAAFASTAATLGRATPVSITSTGNPICRSGIPPVARHAAAGVVQHRPAATAGGSAATLSSDVVNACASAEPPAANAARTWQPRGSVSDTRWCRQRQMLGNAGTDATASAGDKNGERSYRVLNEDSGASGAIAAKPERVVRPASYFGRRLRSARQGRQRSPERDAQCAVLLLVVGTLVTSARRSGIRHVAIFQPQHMAAGWQMTDISIATRARPEWDRARNRTRERAPEHPATGNASACRPAASEPAFPGVAVQA